MGLGFVWKSIKAETQILKIKTWRLTVAEILNNKNSLWPSEIRILIQYSENNHTIHSPEPRNYFGSNKYLIYEKVIMGEKDYRCHAVGMC